MNLILCGLPGSGKTTYGSLLAESQGLPFIDTDQLIEVSLRKVSCRQVYRKKGAIFFRRLESAIVQNLQCPKPTIIATGGGTMMDPANVRYLRAIGTIGYLKASGEFLYDDLMKRGMPAYLDPKKPKESFLALALMRHPIYAQEADFTIELEQHAPEMVVQILRETLQTLAK